MIPTAEIETASPVVRITAQDIKQEGFTNIYQALRALPLATGQVQGQQSATFAGFTPGAQTISLLGLPPGFTLTMIDGQPMTSFPLAYNGQSNITDISNIPLAMIDRIEIVPGGDSSIYGSAAIAGVINFIMKKNVQGIDFNYQTGGYQKGGGYSQRVSLVGGFDHNKFGMTYGFQFLDQQPVWAYQRPFTASSFNNPNAALRGVPFGGTSVVNGNGIAIDPDTLSSTGCAPLASQYGNTSVRFATMGPGAGPGTFAPNGGYTCGSPYLRGYTTLMNQSRTGSGYIAAHYDFSPNMQLYGNLLVSVRSLEYNNGPDFFWWEPNINAFYSGGTPGYIVDANRGEFVDPQYVISPEEAGTTMEGGTHELHRAYQGWGGVKGTFGNSNWNYNAFYGRSQYNVISDATARVTSAIDSFFGNKFLGPELGTTSGFPIYAPNYNNFFQPITPAEVASFTGDDRNSSESYTQNVNLQVTNDDLFSLPAGDLGVAAVLKAGDEQYTEPANPLVVQHYFWGLTAASAAGRRNEYAAALEFHVPIFKILSADISAREDKFMNDGGSQATRPTYKFAFALRPTDTLLLRANYATAFRMPDMSETFAGPSGAFGFVTDYYQCERQHPNTPFGDCSAINSNSINPQIAIVNEGNTNLAPITAKSWGGGVVWSPLSNFNVKVDYYDVRVKNEVQFQSVDTLLLDDAQCLLGQIPQDSAECQQAEAQIVRAGANAPIPFSLTSVSVHPVNVAHERVNGIMASLGYTLHAGRFGDFGANLSYNDTLNHTLQPGPGFPNYDLLRNPYYDALYSQGGSAIGPEFKTIINGSLTWTIHQWASTLTAIRYGHMPNYAMYANPTQAQSFGAYMLAPWVLYNATVQYRITPKLSVTGTVDNLFNTMPEHDTSQTGWPYYDIGAYNVWGRSYFLSMDLKI
ncbi:MAG TPA: TonB-dependent receptor [Rhodanobacteraceae bacterium]|nr:TonB-dependent receptor [Rhodanobacteraceae bacterium]